MEQWLTSLHVSFKGVHFGTCPLTLGEKLAVLLVKMCFVQCYFVWRWKISVFKVLLKCVKVYPAEIYTIAFVFKSCTFWYYFDNPGSWSASTGRGGRGEDKTVPTQAARSTSSSHSTTEMPQSTIFCRGGSPTPTNPQGVARKPCI